ncbi:MAG: NUDIX domain-containing protein [Ilyomonas sp.]
MAKKSAGILAYRVKNHLFEVLLVHPGGPFWKNKDIGAWSIPKGEPDNEEEDLLKAAIREFKEETNIDIQGEFIALEPVKQKAGKTVYAFAVEFDADVNQITSNKITINWPPKSSKKIVIPEVDRAEYFNIIDAAEKINPAQSALIDDLLQKVHGLNNKQIDKVKQLGNIIRSAKLIRFYYESKRSEGKEFKDYREVEPYLIGKYIKDRNKALSMSGYFWPTKKQEADKEQKGQGNYLVDKIDPEKLETLDKMFDTIKVKESNIHNTPTMIIFYKSDKPFAKNVD